MPPVASRHHKPPIDTSVPATLALENGYRPRWLLSDYPEHRWKVTDIDGKPNRTIRFDVRLPNGKRLTDYVPLVESIQRVVYGVRTGPLMEVESGAGQATVASNLIVLARWMIANQIGRFEDLNGADVREYAQLAVYGVHSILNSEGLLNLHLEKLNTVAAFNVSDTLAKRRAKAQAVFPYYTAGKNKQPILARIRLLADAGLDGIGQEGKNSVVTSMLDDIEALCGFSQDSAIRRRMQSARSADELDDEVVTNAHLQRLLMSFDYLYRHRRYLNDALQQAPFPASSAKAEARKLGKAVGRTGSVPVKQAATLIERSIRWVLNYAPVLLELKDEGDTLFDSTGLAASQHLDDEIRRRTWPDNAQGSPFPIFAGSRMTPDYESPDEAVQALALRRGMTLLTALNYLMTACATVIGAFSARRAAEIIGLKAGCIERDEAGRPWMKVFIYKTLQDVEVVPVPEAVASAVAVLERISERARAQTRTAYLFQLNLPGTDTCQGIGQDGAPTFRLGTFLRKFGYFIDVPELGDGTRWTFRPHQFRRFFAILYIRIYELGDWGALSYILRHFNLETTRRYTSGDELGHIIAMADREHTAEILADAALGKIQVSGIEGTRLMEAIKRLYSRMTQRIQVVPERKYVQRIGRFVERTGVTLHALPWGYCAGSSGSAKQACSCSPEQATPDFGTATVSTCKECVFGVRTEAFLPYLKGSLNFHRDIAQSSDAPTIFRKASETLSNELDEYIKSVTPASLPAEITS
jgi:integrase